MWTLGFDRNPAAGVLLVCFLSKHNACAHFPELGRSSLRATHADGCVQPELTSVIIRSIITALSEYEKENSYKGRV